LAGLEVWTLLFRNESSEETIERHETVQEAELIAASDEMARAMARHIFAVFNWNVGDRLLIDWQNKLYKRSGQARSS
jgi:hypothetical protein